jgi:hypothetical protein
MVVEKRSNLSKRPSQYASRSCDQCYRCKLRCTGEHPTCSRCKQAKKTCTYSTGKAKRKEKEEGSESNNPPQVATPLSPRIESSSTLPNWTEVQSCADLHDSNTAPLIQGSHSPATELQGTTEVSPALWVLASPEAALMDLGHTMTTDGNSMKSPSSYVEPYANFVIADYPQDLKQTTIPATCNQGNERMPTPPDSTMIESVSTGFQYLCDQSSSKVINELFICQRQASKSSSADTIFICAQQSLAIVERCATEAKNRDPWFPQSAITVLACIQIVQQVLSCYSFLKTQAFNNEMHTENGSIAIGRFHVHSTEIQKNILEAIISREINLCKEMTQALQLWTDRLMVFRPEEASIITPFMSSLQASLISMTG